MGYSSIVGNFRFFVTEGMHYQESTLSSSHTVDPICKVEESQYAAEWNALRWLSKNCPPLKDRWFADVLAKW